MIVKGARQQSQLQMSQMALIRPSFISSGLQVDAPGMTSLIIPYSPLPKDIIEIEFVIHILILSMCIIDVFFSFIEK
jgi:hypothetical protein